MAGSGITGRCCLASRARRADTRLARRPWVAQATVGRPQGVAVSDWQPLHSQLHERVDWFGHVPTSGCASLVGFEHMVKHGPVQGMCLSMSHALGAMGRPSPASVPYLHSRQGLRCRVGALETLPV
eukprot:scaffold63866_cov31-Phaeocystis_antarctica.AAC.2